MSVIKAEGLSKKYLISHKSGNGYTNVRDVIASKVKGIGRNILRGSQRDQKRQGAEEFWALKDIGFEIEQGDRVGIVGRNGAGKSTLLKVLSRITEPTQGYVRINGRVASLLEVGTGFHPELTGRENIFMNGAILGMSRAEMNKKFDEIVAFSEIEKFLDTPVKRYSSGMYVRLAFAVAAHLEPEILIVDEVLAVGDLGFQRKCLGKISEFSDVGRTVIFVSHNMSAVRSLTNKALLLSDGKLLMQGRTSEVVDTYIKGVRNKSANISIAERTDRTGTGTVKVQDLFVQNAEGLRDQIPMSSEGYAISLTMQGIEPVRISKIIVSVLDSERRRLFWIDSSDQLEPFECPVGTKSINIRLGKGISPAPGEYFLNIAVFGMTEMVDYVADAYKFVIDHGDFYQTGKCSIEGQAALVSHAWELD